MNSGTTKATAGSRRDVGAQVILGLAMVLSLTAGTSELWADYVVFRINVGENAGSGGTAGQPGGVAQPGFPAPGAGAGPGPLKPGGVPGFPPGGVPGQPGQPGTSSQDDAGTADWLLAVLQGEARPSTTSPGMLVFRYDGGQFEFQPNISAANLAEIHWLRNPSLSQEFELLARKRNLAAKAPAELALWMLQHWTYQTGSNVTFDMWKRFEEQLAAWEKMGLEKLPEADRTTIQRLLETRQLLKQELPQDDETLARIGPLARGNVFTTGKGPHYQIVHLQEDQKQAEELLERLERVFHGVYYWFAYHNRPLPLPKYRLTVWLTVNVENYQKLRQALGELRPLPTDGFYSRLERVLVIAPQRLDPAYARWLGLINDVDRQLADVTNRLLGQLFKNQPIPPEYIPTLQKLTKPDPNMKKILTTLYQLAQQDQSALAVLNLAQIVKNSSHAINEEGIVATITHEGTRQILDVIGFLPARAGFSDAWRDGLLALLETPKSSGEFRAPAFHSGMGNIHWVYLLVFNFFNNEARIKKGEAVFYQKTPRQVTVPVKQYSLKQILRGEHYQEVFQAKPEQRDLLITRARAESWALVYFLMHTRWNQLQQFYEELARLPRDMEVSPDVIESLFAMQFGLADDKQPDKLDTNKLQRLEEEWRKFMTKQSLPLRLPAYVDSKPTNPPNNPGLPGGNPGFPGGNPMP
ncbi:MAG: hypothetical protein RMJ82_11495 [Gemmatales bacterium]|nr:hypothetical protein [Gemmatales bacterium]